MLTLILVTLQASVAGKPVAVGPLQNPPPASWVAEKPANLLRSHQFKLPSGNPGLAPAELAIYPESTPKYEQKFAEWRRTIDPQPGLDPKLAIVEGETKLAAGAVAHRLEAQGTWRYKERPRDPKSVLELKENHRVVWVVVTHEGGATHLRLSGPAVVVAEQLPTFDLWLAGLKK